MKNNDYAEFFEKNNKEIDYEPGTVICKVKGEDKYAASTFSTRKLVVGVCSDSYGHILGGENLMNMEDNKKKYIPVALSGRVRVKVVPNKTISEGDLLYVSKEEGLATNEPPFENEHGSIIGKALEDSDGTKEKVLMMVMLK